MSLNSEKHLIQVLANRRGYNVIVDIIYLGSEDVYKRESFWRFLFFCSIKIQQEDLKGLSETFYSSAFVREKTGV